MSAPWCSELQAPQRGEFVRFKLTAVLIGLAILPAGVGVAYALSGSPNPAAKAVKTKRDHHAASERDDAASQKATSHGAAVSTAAHCRLKGAAHGALVRSVAANKSATPAGSRSACLAAGGKPKMSPGHSAHAKVHEKADDPHGETSEAD
jgi:hypothetical protein